MKRTKIINSFCTELDNIDSKKHLEGGEILLKNISGWQM